MEHGIAMEPMKGQWVSSRVDLGYTKLFCVPEVDQCSSRFVTVFLGTLWCSTWKIEAPFMFDWEYGIALHACNAGESSLISQHGGSLIRFLELQQEPVVYTRVTAGMAIRNSILFTEVRTSALL